MMKTDRVVCPHIYTFAPAAYSSERRADWAVCRFDSLELTQVPGVVWCSCAQGKGTFLHIAQYEALLAPRIGAQAVSREPKFHHLGSGNHGRRARWLFS